jgi:hypothetical protein
MSPRPTDIIHDPIHSFLLSGNSSFPRWGLCMFGGWNGANGLACSIKRKGCTSNLPSFLQQPSAAFLPSATGEDTEQESFAIDPAIAAAAFISSLFSLHSFAVVVNRPRRKAKFVTAANEGKKSGRKNELATLKRSVFLLFKIMAEFFHLCIIS